MRLRIATMADALTLFEWANDPETRRASGDRPVIEWLAHLAWFSGRLASPDAVIMIGDSTAGRPVGAIRFETDDGWVTALLSYEVAPEARGRGFGRAVLIEGVAAFRARFRATRIEATVVPGNARSRHLFEGLGWSTEPTESGRVRFVDQARSAP